jgi:hypothetical protein
MRDLAGRDDGGAALSGGADLVQGLAAAGHIALLLAMLKALCPIKSSRKPPASAPTMVELDGGSLPTPQLPARPSTADLPAADLAPVLAQQAAAFPYDQPYFGYRSDILAGADSRSRAPGRLFCVLATAAAVSALLAFTPGPPPAALANALLAFTAGPPPAALANAAARRQAVAAEVSALGGVELVLSQALPDPESPLSREWALWAVRNLCEGSQEAQVCWGVGAAAGTSSAGIWACTGAAAPHGGKHDFHPTVANCNRRLLNHRMRSGN